MPSSRKKAGKSATEPGKEGVSSSRAEEKALFGRLSRGDERARDAIIGRYADWVTNLAKKYHFCFSSIELKELIAEGNRGLLEAMRHYDPGRPVKFSTYAWFWIIKNIQEYITGNIEVIGVPHKVTSELRKITHSMNEEIKQGKEPSLEKISRKLDMDLATVRELLSNKRNISSPLSLDRFLDEEEREQTVSDVVEDKSQATIQEILDRAEGEATLAEVLAQLSPVERSVIELRFGFPDNRFHSLKDVGDKLNIAPAKVKDIEYAAIAKLKRILSEKDQ